MGFLLSFVSTSVNEVNVHLSSLNFRLLSKVVLILGVLNVLRSEGTMVHS